MPAKPGQVCRSKHDEWMERALLKSTPCSKMILYGVAEHVVEGRKMK